MNREVLYHNSLLRWPRKNMDVLSVLQPWKVDTPKEWCIDKYAGLLTEFIFFDKEVDA